MEYMVGAGASALQNQVSCDTTNRQSNAVAASGLAAQAGDSNNSMSSLAGAAVPLAPPTTADGSSGSAAVTNALDSFDFSSLDNLQAQSNVVDQLTASAGFTTGTANNVVFQNASAAQAPGMPQQQETQQQQQHQQQYFVMPQQQAYAAFPQPATAALQTMNSGQAQPASTSAVATDNSTSTTTQQPQQQQYLIPAQTLHPAQLLSAQVAVAAAANGGQLAADANKQPLAAAAFYPGLSPSVVSASTAASIGGSVSSTALNCGGVGDDDDTFEQKRPQNWNLMSAEERRRWERNMREQQRSHKISSQIKELRTVLTESNVPFKPNKYSILLSVAEYIKQLQSRAIMLDAEHRKLIDTIRQTSDMVNAGTAPEPEAAPTPLDTVKDGQTGSNLNNDADMLFVKGLDYRCIFDQCIVAMGIAALDGRILDCNDEFESVLGYSKQELLKHSLFTVMQNHEEVYQAMGEMLKADDVSLDRDLVGRPEEKLPMYWSGIVGQTKQNVKLQANITLTRSSDGLPKFFNCSLMII